jgi:hypothetical protein
MPEDERGKETPPSSRASKKNKKRSERKARQRAEEDNAPDTAQPIEQANGERLPRQSANEEPALLQRRSSNSSAGGSPTRVIKVSFNQAVEQQKAQRQQQEQQRKEDRTRLAREKEEEAKRLAQDKARADMLNVKVNADKQPWKWSEDKVECASEFGVGSDTQMSIPSTAKSVSVGIEPAPATRPCLPLYDLEAVGSMP